MPGVIFLIGYDFETVAEISDHLVQFFGITESESIDYIIGYGSVLGENEYRFLRILGPSSRFYVVLADVKRLIFRHLEKDIHAVRGCENAG